MVGVGIGHSLVLGVDISWKIIVPQGCTSPSGVFLPTQVHNPHLDIGCLYGSLSPELIQVPIQTSHT